MFNVSRVRVLPPQWKGGIPPDLIGQQRATGAEKAQQIRGGEKREGMMCDLLGQN